MAKISPRNAMIWMARMAATDGVITPTERRVLSDFAHAFGLDAGKIIRMAYSFANGVDIPEVDLVGRNEMKGRMFEKFVVSLLGSDCRLLAWRSDKIVGNTYAAENLYPDLHIRHKFDTTEEEYFVECKYRSTWGKGGIDLSEQFNRYYFHAKDHGVELFIALGVGGTPSDPDELFIIPGRMVKLDKKIDRTRFITCLCGKSSEEYRNYIAHYYQKRIFNKQV